LPDLLTDFFRFFKHFLLPDRFAAFILETGCFISPILNVGPNSNNNLEVGPGKIRIEASKILMPLYSAFSSKTGQWRIITNSMSYFQLFRNAIKL